jgi:steroid delta-isomerase-like uncharacterized protein
MDSARALRRLKQVEEHVRLENAHDLEGLMSVFGSSGFYDDEAWGEHHTGLEGVRGYYMDLMKAAPDFHIEVKRTHVGEEAIILEVVLTGTHQGAWRGLPPTGRRICVPICGVFTFDEEDRLAGEKVYYDRITVLRQLGVLSEPTSVRGRIGALVLHPLNVVSAMLGFRRGARSDGPTSAHP